MRDRFGRIRVAPHHHRKPSGTWLFYRKATKINQKVHALTSATHDRQTRFCGFLRSGRRVCDWIVRCGRPLDLSLVILFSRRLEIFLRLTETTYIKEFSECDGGVVVGKQSKNVGWHSGVENAQAKGTTFQGAAGAFQSKQDTGADCDQPCAQNRESLFFCPGEMNKKKGKVKTHLALVASSLSLYLSVCPYTFFQALYGTKQKLLISPWANVACILLSPLSLQ